jgi:hypothetical protein
LDFRSELDYDDAAAIGYGFLPQGVVDLFPVAAGVGEAGLFQYLQVVGDRGLANVSQLLYQVADTQLAAADQAHDPLAGLVGYGFAKDYRVI